MVLVVGPSIPSPLKPLLTDVVDALSALVSPNRPTRLFARARADLPPASDHPSCLVLVTDLNILAHSDGSHWIRQDTGGVV